MGLNPTQGVDVCVSLFCRWITHSKIPLINPSLHSQSFNWVLLLANSRPFDTNFLISSSVPKSQSELLVLYDWRFTAKHFISSRSPFVTHDQHFFSNWTLAGVVLMSLPLSRENGFVVYKFLLVLASAVILMSESRWTHDRIFLSQFRDSPNLKGWSS
jgi:hypothetical protein